MKTWPIPWALVVVGLRSLLVVIGLGALLGCSVTMAELRARNLMAKTLKVHCRPWKMAHTANILAMRSSGDYLHTDETPSALREFAKDAGVFIVIDKAAPQCVMRSAKSNAGQYLRRDHIEYGSVEL